MVYSGSRIRSPPVPVVLSVYQRGSLLDGLAMYLSCDTKKFHDNESTHTYYIIFGRPSIGGKRRHWTLPLWTLRQARPASAFVLTSEQQHQLDLALDSITDIEMKSDACIRKLVEFGLSSWLQTSLISTVIMFVWKYCNVILFQISQIVLRISEFVMELQISVSVWTYNCRYVQLGPYLKISSNICRYLQKN